jgi:hypothetical protein
MMIHSDANYSGLLSVHTYVANTFLNWLKNLNFAHFDEVLLSSSQLEITLKTDFLSPSNKSFLHTSDGGWNYKPHKQCLLTQAKKKATTNIGS